MSTIETQTGGTPPPATRTLDVVLREALAAGEELRLIVAKGLADDGSINANAYMNVEIEGVPVAVPKLAGSGLGGPASGYPVYLLAALDFLLALGTVKGSASGAVATDVPIGAILAYGGSSAPSGYVLADGSFLSKTTYAALYGVFGTTYGDGGSTFGVPDLRKRVPVGPGSSLGRGATDGLAEASRHPLHHHRLTAGFAVNVAAVGDHSHGAAGNHNHSLPTGDDFAGTFYNTGQRGTAGTTFTLVSSGSPVTGNSGDHTHPAAGGHGHSASGSVDADTSGGGPSNGPSYIVVNFVIRAT